MEISYETIRNIEKRLEIIEAIINAEMQEAERKAEESKKTKG